MPRPDFRRLSPWLLVLAGAVLRGALLLRVREPPALWGGDARTYVEILEGLLRGSIPPEAWIWPPGFPLLALPLAPILGAGNALQVVAFLTGAATPALLLLAGRAVGLPRLAAIATAIVAFHPEAAVAAARPLSGAPALFLSVLLVVAIEALCRTRRMRWAVLAGVAAGLSVLTRPELLVSALLVGAIAAVTTARVRRVLATYAVVAAAVLAPHVLGLHAAAGVWTLSLKPQFNILKTRVYEEGATFEERRVLWDARLDDFRDERGSLDPRRLAAAASPSRHFLSAEVPRVWLRNLLASFPENWPASNLLWLLGGPGLLLRGRGERTRLLAVASATPFLAVPLLLPPVHRYALVTVPALAWGAGILLLGAEGRGRGRARAVATPAVLALFALLSLHAAVRETDDHHWIGRGGEFRVELERGDLRAAETLVREGLTVDPENPAIHEALGTLRAREGDRAGAVVAWERAARLGGDRVRLAALLVGAGDPGRAEAMLDPARASAPATAEYSALEGNLAFARGDWQRAAAFFREAASRGAPPDLMALNEGLSLLRAGRPDEARAPLEAASRSSNLSIRRRALAGLGAEPGP